jgi:hypothetical protein
VFLSLVVRLSGERSEASLQSVAKLLHADAELLRKALTMRTIVTREDTFVRAMSLGDALASRDSPVGVPNPNPTLTQAVPRARLRAAPS